MWQIGTLAPFKPEDFAAVAHSEQQRPRLRYSVQCPSLSANAPCPEISPAQTHSRSMGSGFPGGTDLRTPADRDQRARSDSDPNALGQITSIVLFLSAMGTLGPCGSICRPVTHLGGGGVGNLNWQGLEAGKIPEWRQRVPLRIPVLQSRAARDNARSPSLRRRILCLSGADRRRP